MTERTSLVEDFQRYFTVEIAASPEQLRSVYRIRYQVYCEEFEYESAAAFPDGLETDDFDDDSIHCLITHKGTDMPAGCVRVVRGVLAGQLPLEKFCHAAVYPEELEQLAAHRAQTCEVSRLAVYKGFRRRPGEHATRFGLVDAPDVSPQERRTFPLIAVAAYLSANAVADLLQIERLYAMMEPFLPKLMRRSAGINFTRVGDDIDYHGLRAPYITAPEQVVRDLLPDLRELYDAIRAGFEPSVAAPARQSAAGGSAVSGALRATGAGGR